MIDYQMQNTLQKQEEIISQFDENYNLPQVYLSVRNDINLPIQTTSQQSKTEIELITDKPLEILDNQLCEAVCIDNTNIFLIGYFGRKVELAGRLKVTNIKLSFLTTTKLNLQEILFQIPIGYMQKVERYNEDKQYFSLQVSLKYGVSFKIRYSDQKTQICMKTHQLLAYLIENPLRITAEYALKISTQLKCQKVPRNNEVFKDSHWYDNQSWKKFPNYPQNFRVPLPYLSKNNPQQRLVVFSFSYNNGKQQLAVWRTGPGKPDPSQQQWMSKVKSNPKLFTIQIKNKGIGSSRSLASKIIEIQSVTHLKENFFSLVRLCFDNHESLKWISNLISTKWYEQVSLLLEEASQLVKHLLNGSAQVTILADCQVRASQIVAICQVLLFPQYRTIKGLGQLVQRQFLQWGSSRSLSKRQPQPQRGPALIQFFDVLFQLISIYPLSFQFSQAYLVFLAQQVYSNRFGNFLLLTKLIKEDQRSSIQIYTCVWKTLQKFIQNQDLACYYLNPFYVDYKQCDIYELKQSPSLKQIRLWNGFFFKRFKQHNPDYHIFHRYNQLNAQHFRNKLHTEQLRSQLTALMKNVQQRKQILSELKTFS